MKLLLLAMMISLSGTAFGSGGVRLNSSESFEKALDRAAKAGELFNKIQKGKKLFKQCQSCHGLEAISTNDYIPNLACQNEGYLIRQFYNFKSWKRAHGTMSRIAKTLSLSDMRSLSAYLGSFSRCSIEPEIDLETECGKRTDKQSCVVCCFKFDSIQEINKCTSTCDTQLKWTPILK